MQENQAVMVGILRFLIKDIGMVAVQGFASIIRRFRRPLVVSRCRDNRTASEETPLVDDSDRFHGKSGACQ